jgi:septum formation protein
MDRRLILASASPRRQDLLRNLGLEFDVVPSRVVETYRDGESPEDRVIRLAAEKTNDVALRFPECWVIGADTVVVTGEEILGKPETKEEAKRMLKLLSGRDHWVFTGYSIATHKKGAAICRVVGTRVRMKNLNREEIEWYVRTGEPFGKAGGYAIQGAGSFMVEEIEGSYTNVVGLPICQVLQSLRELGAVEFK